jgi:dTDP-4-dehydrorhamnose reductase
MDSGKRILIFGGTGFIGRNLARIYRGQGYEVLAEHYSVTDLSVIDDVIDDTKPDLVINAAGRKDISYAEESPTITYNINAIGASLVAISAKYSQSPTKCVHISSDHAYTGSNTVYAKSKRLGDELVMAENPNASVVVTGHVYAPDCPWIKWLGGELSAGRQVIAHNNRICCPTWIGDLAEAILKAPTGKTVCVGSSICTRGDLFRAYANVFGYNRKLIVDGRCEDPLLIGDSRMVSDWDTLGIVDGLALMRFEMTNTSKVKVNV